MSKAQGIAQSANQGQFKNRIINGAMMIDQRNAGASITPTNTASGTYGLDRWATYGSAASKFSVQQDAGAVTPPAGFNDYLGITSLSSYTVGAGEIFSVFQNIEGFNVSDFAFGTTNAQPVTLSFWVRSSLTGTFGGSINNSAQNRSYVFNYTISSANTWEQKTVTISGDTTGTWLITNGVGLSVLFSLGAGSSFSTTPNTWTAATRFSTTGAISVVGTNGATFYITGVQLEKGSTATSFDYRPYGTELALCQRYYERMSVLYMVTAWVNIALPAPYKVQKRTTPTIINTPDGGTGGAYAHYLATNLTAGTEVIFQTTANSAASGGSIQLSAEL